MIIRKKFSFDGSHIVRNCFTKKCRQNIHGHTYVVELFLTSQGLDNGQMVVDFGLLKNHVKDIVDSFDHAHTIWNAEDDEFKQFFKDNNDRWVITPMSPSAEGYAIMLFMLISAVISNTDFNNGERMVRVESVRVHETPSGYAEAFLYDVDRYANEFGLDDFIFSDGVMDEWNDREMIEKIKNGVPFVTPTIRQTHNIKNG